MEMIFIILKEWLGWETRRWQGLRYFLISSSLKRLYTTIPGPYLRFGIPVDLYILIPNHRFLEVHEIHVDWTEWNWKILFRFKSLCLPFSVALLLVSPYKGVKVSSSCHGASHLYSRLCRLLFSPKQEWSGSSPFQICDQETRSKLMEKFLFCSWCSRVWRDGARTRTCQRAGRGDGEDPGAHSLAPRTRSEEATAGRR